MAPSPPRGALRPPPPTHKKHPSRCRGLITFINGLYPREKRVPLLLFFFVCDTEFGQHLIESAALPPPLLLLLFYLGFRFFWWFLGNESTPSDATGYESLIEIFVFGEGVIVTG